MAAFGTSIPFGSAAAAANTNPNKDLEVPNAPSDGISSLRFSPASNLMVATSWSGQVLCWDVQATTGQAIPKAATTLDKPVLCSAWSADGSTVFAGGCDNGVKMWNLGTNQQQQVAQHAAPVRHCFFMRQMNMLVTGSWDKTVKYWDLRSPTPAHTQPMPERVYAMDVRDELMVVGTADRQLQVFNLGTPGQVYKSLASPLKYQTRCIACFPDKTGYLLGSIEGRVAVHHVEDALQSKNFTFKCHREGQDVYAVNHMAFHPQFGTFVTAGSDGAYNFWDKDSKQRLKAMAKCGMPIPCGDFNRRAPAPRALRLQGRPCTRLLHLAQDGSIYAYAVSYDWSRGYSEYNPTTAKNQIFLHAPQESEVKGRTRPAAGARR
ncbi:hypothetical protein CHLNCDRAFT_23906 [Chlorella variabilis]|uniref:Anaphase-promoting complex subunit 4 WD40 domain-containing protein n=1 Tax=Chlorella variabilis TaxID=554065 RepID=E1ZH67_CHLVA|nr:hypothetical protein CHLNCDRAFT_23906 [Chlorella variabilis]EFN55068.1 hypothetical protein CHLNCDRAFT_23906 [Chlorella variabilis]|eukprot:XP_005847170.1 hypothetical protein CHLNCDRAFT_23906 [Chlorella variabilis]